ncbi:MAG: hypothetical protein FWG37_06730, partial [Clostridia bacterium]|nr:hypothetical protein [Clostridia bacterium]
DSLSELIGFAGRLEKACYDTLSSGVMTADLAALAESSAPAAPTGIRAVDTEEFIEAVVSKLEI